LHLTDAGFARRENGAAARGGKKTAARGREKGVRRREKVGLKTLRRRKVFAF